MKGKHIIVVGAGAFGGWTALHLLHKSARVTLVDAWGAGHPKASSGDESRVIRHTYQSRIYVDMAIRSLELWREFEARWSQRLFHQTGVLWMAKDNDVFEQTALRHLREAAVAHQILTIPELTDRFPQINPEGIRWALFEMDAGFLLARRGCEAVLKAFLRAGGEYRTALVTPGSIRGGELVELRLADQTALKADGYVFACGPWLGQVFPEVFGHLIRPTRQEVFYFGIPPENSEFANGNLPVWADHGERFWYGIPDTSRGLFKVADDTRGPEFDPTTGDRTPSSEGLQAARSYMEFRFPGLCGAPLLEARVCQYETTPDNDFIVDRHPDAPNVWFAGGGSGHGYKHGPALGEHMAERVLGEKAVEAAFGLGRFGR